jgi:hypothetical protein
MAGSYPHWNLTSYVRCQNQRRPRQGGPDLGERQAHRGAAPYGSIMCSTAGDGIEDSAGPSPHPAALDRLAAAIEERAAAAQAPGTRVQDVTALLARLWEMVADLDPELARRLAEYGG